MIIVTGTAGFIGSHVAQALLDRGEQVVGIDNVNDYYDVALKEARLARLQQNGAFAFHRANVADRAAIFAIFERHDSATSVIHLAAQAGVRYSLEDPYTYVEANVMGQVVMLEAARRLRDLRNFTYASSSSVYGENTDLPFSVEDRVDLPMSLYAASKRSGELIARVYAHLYRMPTVGLRFFSVYGPWGRPDMAAYLFADAIAAGRPIHLFNGGDMQRDFTFITDIVKGVLAANDRLPLARGNADNFLIYNLGNHRPENLMDFIGIIERCLGREAQKIIEPMQPGDVKRTYAGIAASREELGFEPSVPISSGVPQFIDWFKTFRGLA